MKKCVSILLAAVLLFTSVYIGAPKAHAATKPEKTRAIAIVFDNSGSMYKNGNQAWCRATYATEVFASMLNKGDVLHIYPMNPIIIEGKTYSMQDPFVITDASQASLIRGILTPGKGDTHIESIDCAINGLKNIQADKKYLLVLSDGDEFYRNKKGLGDQSKKHLDAYFVQASKEIPMMYLSIGAKAIVPDTPESSVFVKRQAKNSEDVLSALMELCNLIFGRDTLPKNRITGKTINFDVSMKKLIVFVQGENISDLKLTDSNGALVGTVIASQQVKYPTKGSDDYPNNVDTSLQGMMVTYTGCAAGTYNLEHTGTATSVEVYYEPDADLDFVFTNADGSAVDPNALYEGEYKVSFGMKDAKTGKLISSNLLGNPHYEGSYFINGQEYPISHDGYSGETPVSLKMGDTFDANLTATYLSGYTITKNSADFGWPEGGIQVAARPAGDLRLEISGGDSSYSLQELEEGSPYIVKVFYQGTQLTGSELEKVALNWNPEASNAILEKEFAEDHWKLTLHYKDPAAPQNTVCGECTVPIQASYCAPGSNESQTQGSLTYNIQDLFSPVQLELSVPESYIVIKDLEDSQALTAKLTIDGRPLTPEEFAVVQLQADCGGIEYSLTANEQDSSYSIKLLPTKGIKEGNYTIKVTSVFTDQFGRTAETDAESVVTLSAIPLWMKWVIGFLLLLILFLIIWAILHIKVLPTKAHTTKKLSNLNFDGEDVTKSASFLSEIKKDGARMHAQYGGRKFGLLMDVTPGQESYLYKSHKGRSAEVKPASVRKFGPAKIQEALIGTAKYTVDDETGKLVPALPNQKPFLLKNGTTVRYSGTISDAGIDKDFEVLSKISFNKK